VIAIMSAFEQPDYWLDRLTQTFERAADAGNDQSRSVLLALANHYCAMHLMVHGRADSGPSALAEVAAANAAEASPRLRWAA
jgi:hypothetical protein